MSSDGDELQTGAEITGSSRTVTDAEIALLPAFMGAISPLFHDEETARKSKLGRRVLYGPALLGIAIASTEPAIRDAVIALAGIDEVRFRRPVGAGDTVTASLTVIGREARPGKPGDLLTVHDRVHNQERELVLEFKRTIIVRGAGDKDA